jgi:hypothetical protein
MGHESPEIVERPDSVNWPPWKIKLYLNLMARSSPALAFGLAYALGKHQVTEPESPAPRDTNGA